MASGYHFARAEHIPVFFIFENFSGTRLHKVGVQNRISWIYGEAQLSKDLKVVGSLIDLPLGFTVLRFLDEGYAEYRHKDMVGRVGRIRSRFGFDDWSELFYTPIIQAPVIRANAVNSLGLLRMDTGFDVQGGSPNLQYQVAMVDVHNDGWQLTPRHMDHGVARLQATVGDLMIGVNALSRVSGSGNNDAIGGLDLRWTHPHWQLRGELIKGFADGANAEGGYLDAFYRPERLFRSQFGVRTEFYKDLAGKRTNLHTMGVRQILSKEFALSMNYGWGSTAAPTGGLRGWSLQLMTAIRF